MGNVFDFKDLNINEDGTLGEPLDVMSKKIRKKSGVDIKTASKLGAPNLVSSGVFLIDLANFGGFPDHSGTMIHGVKSSGKSTLSLLSIREHQLKYPNKKVLYLAIEKGCFNVEWAFDLGIDLDKLLVIDDAVSAEQYIELMEEYIRTNSISLIIVDSTPELLPSDDLMKDVDREMRMGANARMVSLLINKYILGTSYLKQVANVLNEKKPNSFNAHIPSILFINQRREKMNTTFPSAQLPGGNKLLHFPLLTMELKSSESGDESGLSVKNTHTFNLGGANNRNKATGKLFETGTYDISTSNKHYRGKKGLVDDYATVVKQSFKYGLSDGAGTSYKCCVYKDTKFKSHKEIEDAIVNDEKNYWLLRACIIAKARLENGMSLVPPDNNLQHCTKEEIINSFKNIGLEYSE